MNASNNVIPMREPRGKRVRRAIDEWHATNDQWVEKTMALAVELKAARDECGGDDRALGHWLVDNDCELDPNKRAGFIGMGTHVELSRQVLKETKSRSIRLIWENEIKPRIYSSAAIDAPVATNISEPAVSAPVAVEPKQPTPSKVQEPTAPTVEPALYDAPKTSKLRDILKPRVAEVLLTSFKHTRMLVKLHTEQNHKQFIQLMGYLAERCVTTDYPDELKESPTWSFRLLYPHLPQKLLDLMPASIGTLVRKHHNTLIETEKRFIASSAFGITNPPMAAFNKAQEIYSSLIHTRNGGGPVDPSVHHRPVYVNDEGKPPVIICGVQLWPAEEGAGYGYEDLRCACGLTDDVLCTFGEPRDAPMTTKSLKLRHLLAWLPGGYNSTGSTIDGMLKALKDVVQAYGSHKSDVMRKPLPSLKKLDEVCR